MKYRNGFLRFVNILVFVVQINLAIIYGILSAEPKYLPANSSVNFITQIQILQRHKFMASFIKH